MGRAPVRAERSARGGAAGGGACAGLASDTTRSKAPLASPRRLTIHLDEGRSHTGRWLRRRPHSVTPGPPAAQCAVSACMRASSDGATPCPSWPKTQAQGNGSATASSVTFAHASCPPAAAAERIQVAASETPSTRASAKCAPMPARSTWATTTRHCLRGPAPARSPWPRHCAGCCRRCQRPAHGRARHWPRRPYGLHGRCRDDKADAGRRPEATDRSEECIGYDHHLRRPLRERTQGRRLPCRLADQRLRWLRPRARSAAHRCSPSIQTAPSLR